MGCACYCCDAIVEKIYFVVVAMEVVLENSAFPNQVEADRLLCL
jgi:hypothetical protein